MPIAFTCPHCGNQLNVADHFAGQTGPCSACGKPIKIPFAAANYASRPASGSRGAGLTIAIVVGVLLLGGLMCGGILLALLLPAVSASRQAAKRMQSSNNLRQLGIAMHNYHDEYSSFPPAVVKDENGTPLYSGRVLLLPYLEQGPLYERFDKTKAWNAPENAALTSMPVKTFQDPGSSAGDSPRSDYLFVTGPGTIFEDGKRVVMADVTDGLSNTMYIIETSTGAANWAEPKDFDISQLGTLPPGNHPAGNLVGITDGSVQTLSKQIDPLTLHGLMTRNGGEAVSY
jgi:hypothetical protein